MFALVENGRAREELSADSSREQKQCIVLTRTEEKESWSWLQTVIPALLIAMEMNKALAFQNNKFAVG